MNVIYTGELVRLRPFHDMEEWLTIQREPEFSMSPFWGPFQWPVQQQRESYEQSGRLATDGGSSFAVERLDSGEIVGIEDYGAIRPGVLTTWLGTCLAGRHHGRGFGREAKLLVLCFLFENFPLQSVYADTTAEHLRAQLGLEAIGMRQVGSYAACHWRDGKLIDVPLYQIMREQWEQLPIRSLVRRG